MTTRKTTDRQRNAPAHAAAAFGPIADMPPAAFVDLKPAQRRAVLVELLTGAAGRELARATSHLTVVFHDKVERRDGDHEKLAATLRRDMLALTTEAPELPNGALLKSEVVRGKRGFSVLPAHKYEELKRAAAEREEHKANVEALRRAAGLRTTEVCARTTSNGRAKVELDLDADIFAAIVDALPADLVAALRNRD